MIYYVNGAAPEGGDGGRELPFQKIQQAADVAAPGDEIVVAPGVYREAVDPARGGTETQRIVFRSEVKHGAVITGAEQVRKWTHIRDGVWRARIGNAVFGGANPYTTRVSGDWFMEGYIAHTGEVYLNGRALYEVTSPEDVFSPQRDERSWDPDFTVYTWFAEQDGERDETVLLANFHDFDPTEECVEINVRANCFLPSREGLGYITLSGFRVTKAATQWAPPTAYQDGMIGPHWSKGWIIEDCDISDSKCSGISLGKYLQPNNDNKWLKWKYKDGTQTERDCICQALGEGWSRENVGSHIVRRCDIHDCGQTGIVGHLGGAFSVIEDNHIHHINNRQNLAGAEIGGIKMHAAIDVVLRRNHIHHCTRGLWLDWQAQGTRVTRNLFHDNSLPYSHLMREEALGALGEDIFVEVSHGPTLIDNNVLLSTRALKLPTQGMAVVHNLIAGSLAGVGTGVNNGSKSLYSPRFTPYHVPHGTEVAGFMTILHGDMRFYNNVFVQREVDPFLKRMETEIGRGEWDDMNVTAGTAPYGDYPTFEEWRREFEGPCGLGSGPSDRYYMPLPVWTGGNLFVNGARAGAKEQNYLMAERAVRLELVERGGGWYLDTNLGEVLAAGTPGAVSSLEQTAEAASPLEETSGAVSSSEGAPLLDTEALGMAFEPEMKFENPDGTPITFDTDYFGERRESALSGPFAAAASAVRRLA